MERGIALAAVVAIIAAMGFLLMTAPVETDAVMPSMSVSDDKRPEIQEAPFHIGIITGGTAQPEDNISGALEMIRLYGDASEGGMIRHITYPDDFMKEMDVTVSRIAEMAEDPLMKVIVAAQALPGTAQAFRLIKEKRPDILCLAGEIHEAPEVIGEFADLIVNSDYIARSYLIPHTAKLLGAKTLVHISFPRNMIYTELQHKRDIIEAACNDLGLKFAYENAPDPMGSAGIEGARGYIAANFQKWLKKYGPDTAFFCTNDAHTIPLLQQIAAFGGYFVEAETPSPLLDYPEAFLVDLRNDTEKWPVILNKLDDAVMKAGAGGRMGTWAYPLGYCETAGLAEFGKLVAEGKTSVTDATAILDCLGKFSPGSRWNGVFYSDVPGNRTEKMLFVYQDTYVFGKGYIGTVNVPVPDKYFGIPYPLNSGQNDENGKNPLHIGIVTGYDSQGDDDWQGANEIKRLYGDTLNGGIIKHLIYSANFMDDEAMTIRLIESLAEDPLMKVIVVNQAVPGTAEAFRRIGLSRPDIVKMAGEAHEDPDVIGPYADLIVNEDFITRGYLIPRTAHELGADTFVHISFLRHMEQETLLRRYSIMEKTCRDLGMKFVTEYAPDPIKGVAGEDDAYKYITSSFPAWIEKYGKNTAFFPTNDAHTEPLLKSIAKWGGFFVEADLPSPLTGYPKAFNVDVGSDSDDLFAVTGEIEKAVIASGASGRVGTWIHSLGFCQSAGMAEFGKMIAEGRANIGDMEKLLECFEKFSPGAKWKWMYFSDSRDGKPMRNFFLIYQDTYVFGKGFMGNTRLEIPEKYLIPE